MISSYHFHWSFKFLTFNITRINLWSKVVCFVLSWWDLPNYSASSCRILGMGKLFMSKGALTWFKIVWSYSLEAIDYWTIFSTSWEPVPLFLLKTTWFMATVSSYPLQEHAFHMGSKHGIIFKLLCCLDKRQYPYKGVLFYFILFCSMFCFLGSYSLHDLSLLGVSSLGKVQPDFISASKLQSGCCSVLLGN
jgi:hypothetical protein